MWVSDARGGAWKRAGRGRGTKRVPVGTREERGRDPAKLPGVIRVRGEPTSRIWPPAAVYGSANTFGARPPLQISGGCWMLQGAKWLSWSAPAPEEPAGSM